MQKGKLIKEVIGPIVEPEGFVLDKEIDTWGFFKQFKNSKGEIARQIIAFYGSNHSKKLYMDLRCFSGGFRTYRINHFVPGCVNGGIDYQTDEEFPQVVEQYASILKEYGLNFLKEIAEPKRDDYFRQEDYDRLFQDHAELAQIFMKNHKIVINEITLEEAVALIRKCVKQEQSYPFEKCRDNLLRLTAFYGEVLSKTYSCRWEMTDFKTHSVCTLEIDSSKKNSLFVSKIIRFAWKGKMEQLDELLI